MLCLSQGTRWGGPCPLANQAAWSGTAAHVSTLVKTRGQNLRHATPKSAQSNEPQLVNKNASPQPLTASLLARYFPRNAYHNAQTRGAKMRGEPVPTNPRPLISPRKNVLLLGKITGQDYWARPRRLLGAVSGPGRRERAHGAAVATGWTNGRDPALIPSMEQHMSLPTCTRIGRMIWLSKKVHEVKPHDHNTI